MKLWGGRFSGSSDPDFERFSESFSLDQRLIPYDLRVNRAYVEELGASGVLSLEDVSALTQGLTDIESYVSTHPRWALNQSAEDVHTWVEERLENLVGAVAGKLRTGRSRNDLVATETRLYAKDAIREIAVSLLHLLEALVGQAQQTVNVVLPGYTHLQPAQPILFAHYLLAYFEMFKRDGSRLDDCRARLDELPMGAGALAGTAFPINRERLAKSLGFARVARNSLDVTSDRDFVAELLFVCSLALTHSSRLAEDLIIYASPGFGLVEIADAYSTGSSLMPQKKNADALELIRGKASRVSGRLAGTLSLLKGLPLAYDRDLQEDKQALFDGMDTTRDALEIAARVVVTLKVDAARMQAATSLGFLTATDLADELVSRGIPFASAHEQVGKLVRHCSQQRITFGEVDAAQGSEFIPAWDANLAKVATSPERTLDRRDVTGGTAPRQVKRQLRSALQVIASWKRQFSL